jgi:hypothetical protein
MSIRVPSSTSANAIPPSNRKGLPVWPDVAPAMAEPDEPEPAEPDEPEPAAAAAAAVVVAGGVATSTIGSLVIVNVADPSVTESPLTACSPPAVTKYTVVPALIDGEFTVTVIAWKVAVSLLPFSKIPTPKVTAGVPPPGGVTDEEDASVMTTCTGPVNVPAFTVTVIVEFPIVALAVPPLGWMVVLVTTVPARPLAVPPGVGAGLGV